MRFLYPVRYFPALSETFVALEIAGVARRGHPVTVAALGRRPDARLAPPVPEATVWRVPRHPLRAPLRPDSPGSRWLADHQRPKDLRRYAWLAGRLSRLLRDGAGPDAVHAHFAGEAAEWAHALRRDLGLPYSVTVHAVDLFRPRPSLEAVLRGARHVFTVAEHHRARLAARGLAARLLRCGPRLEDWRLPPPPPGPLRALCVARAVPKKGLDTLVAAWRLLDDPEARLEIVSDLPDPGLPGLVVRGPLPPEGVRAALARANLVVLAARRAPDGDMDGVPLVLMEALAAGRAVVTTPVSGIPELVDEAVGWLVPPDDPAALARALGQPEAERRARGARGPARLRRRGFTLDDQVSGLLAAWGAAPRGGGATGAPPPPVAQMSRFRT